MLFLIFGHLYGFSSKANFQGYLYNYNYDFMSAFPLSCDFFFYVRSTYCSESSGRQ